MNEKTTKRSNSFRKILPNLFFPSKSKQKTDESTKRKNGTDEIFQRSLSYNNTYKSPCHNGQSRNLKDYQLKREQYCSTPEDHRIYENLNPQESLYSQPTSSSGVDNSNTSSSSTLVSEITSTKLSRHNEREKHSKQSDYSKSMSLKDRINYELSDSFIVENKQKEAYLPANAFYHDMDKASTCPSQCLPLGGDRVVKRDPHSVGAEIKCSSAQFTISPIKESAVRLNKQQRASTLEPVNKKYGEKNIHYLCRESDYLKSTEYDVGRDSKKTYSYSALPTTIFSANKKPNMPEVHKSVSPYDHVRKSIDKFEKTSAYNYLSSVSKNHEKYVSAPNSPNLTENRMTYSFGPNGFVQGIPKETTRQNVEAFYWQRLTQLKAKEQYLLERSLKGRTTPQEPTYSNTIAPENVTNDKASRSSCEPRGSSVNRLEISQQNLHLNENRTQQPFVRGEPRRSTVGAIHSNKCTIPDTDIVLRNPKNVPLLRNVNNNISCNSARSFFPEENYKKKSLYHLDNYKPLPENDCLKKALISIEQFPRHRHQNMLPATNPVVKFTKNSKKDTSTNKFLCSESESGSEAGEVQRIMQCSALPDDDQRNEDYQSALSDAESGRGPTRGRPSRRDDPRRHTLAGSHHYMHAHRPQQLSALDLEHGKEPRRSNAPEYAAVYKNRPPTGVNLFNMRKQAVARGYQPPTAALFDDDPGIMSEVETSSTGFRRGGKQRSSLPVVRTPSKTLERPLGLVFLQFRNETKRALLPNEITSIDTVKALFVRSFPQQLNMHYMDSPLVKIYIHDSSKDMFYELEDMRAHLRDIGDRSVLRLFESVEMGGGGFPGALNVGAVSMPPGAAGCSGPNSWDQDQSYFSEPEIDSEYHHQHIHKSKQKVAPQAYYMGSAAPSTLPRGGSLLRTYSPAAPPVPADRVKSLPLGAGRTNDSYMVESPERANMRSAPYEDAYYAHPPVCCPPPPSCGMPINEEPSDALLEEPYQMYGLNPNMTPTAPPRPSTRAPYISTARMNQAAELARMRDDGERWIGVERQLATLSGLVSVLVKPDGSAAVGAGGAGAGAAAGTSGGPPPAPRLNLEYPYRGSSQDADGYATTMKRAPRLGKDRYQKSVSFEKSVSFSDDPPDMNSPKQHSPIHAADTKPPKPAIKSSTLPRTSSQERDRLKPAPPPKPVGLSAPAPPHCVANQPRVYINLTPNFAATMRETQSDALDLQLQLSNLRRTVLNNSMAMRKLISDTTMQINSINEEAAKHNDSMSRMEEAYRQDMLLLENDLYDLEDTVERLRGQAANGEARVNMPDVERIAMVLSRSSKTVTEWKAKLPGMIDGLKAILRAEIEKCIRKERLLDQESDRVELAVRRCKKLTGTLVTLKRLACVQEQRLPCGADSGSHSPSCSSSMDDLPTDSDATAGTTPKETPKNKGSDHGAGGRPSPGTGAAAGRAAVSPVAAIDSQPRAENALDALLDELQTFAKPPAERGSAGAGGEATLRRLHSYPSGSDTDASPPVRARHQQAPKPPVPERHPELLALATRRAPPPPPPRTTSRSPLASPTSPGSPTTPSAAKSPSVLEQRHQALLQKQRALQEQYARLQMIQRSSNSLPLNSTPDLKKTGSESNLLGKMNLNMSVSGSLTHLAASAATPTPAVLPPHNACLDNPHHTKTANSTATKVYETDIL